MGLQTDRPPPPKPSLSAFEYTKEAALKNSLILKKYDYDFTKAIEAQPGTTVSYGSEVRPMEQLEILLHNHPNFPRFRSNMTKGISYPLEELDEDTRLNMLNKQLQKGNHKSTMDEEARKNTTKSMQTDVERGFGIIITKKCAALIKGAEAYPLGMQHQTTINERGESIPKKRLTHDLSNERKKGLSINQQVKEDLIPTVIFGYALMRVLTKIHQLRLRYPNERILLNKVDIEKAYRHLHTSGQITAKCIATWYLDQFGENNEYSISEEEIAVALGRLPFGSTPAPAEFSNCSKMCFDLANDLMNCKLWDPSELPCPLREHIPPPKRLPDNAPFGKACEATVSLHPDFKGGTDGCHTHNLI